MHFVRYDRLDGIPHVIVDGQALPGSRLVLSHQPGAPTPRALLADTSAEIVLNFLRLPDWREQLAGVEAISNDHFDLDGLLAAWALIAPDEATARAARVAEAARAGDFNRYQEDFAAQLACLTRGTAEWPATPAGRSLAGLSGFARDAALYTDLLPLAGAMLDDIVRFDE